MENKTLSRQQNYFLDNIPWKELEGKDLFLIVNLEEVLCYEYRIGNTQWLREIILKEERRMDSVFSQNKVKSLQIGICAEGLTYAYPEPKKTFSPKEGIHGLVWMAGDKVRYVDRVRKYFGRKEHEVELTSWVTRCLESGLEARIIPTFSEEETQIWEEKLSKKETV